MLVVRLFGCIALVVVRSNGFVCLFVCVGLDAVVVVCIDSSVCMCCVGIGLVVRLFIYLLYACLLS